MKGGERPVHLVRWAPADFTGDNFVKLLIARSDFRTLAFFTLVLNWSFIEGGDVPADPEYLGALIGMRKRDVARSLPLCLEVGKLEVDGTRIFNRRVRREVAKALEFRRAQAELGREGGLIGGRGRPLSRRPSPIGVALSGDRGTSDLPIPSTNTSTNPLSAAPAGQALAVREPSPFVGDRTALEVECLALAREIGVALGRDPAEVMAEASEWKGRRKLNPASMTPERLLNTVIDLRRMKAGGSRRAAPPESRALARRDSAMALIRGGMKGD